MSTTAATETAEEIAALLAADSEVVRRLLHDYPNLPDAWEADFWADALLRGRQLPGQPWRSHDLRRPQPEVVPISQLECTSTAAPKGSTVLFDGQDLEQWAGPRTQWRVVDGAMQPKGEQSNRLRSRPAFGSARVHLEFAIPEPPLGRWQFRGNSGLFLMGLYEIQILDSWNNPVYPDGQSGAVYGQYPPLVNASLPPGRWQCLDVHFTAPTFDGDDLVSPAKVTVILNGIRVQDDVALLGPTGFGAWREYAPHAARLPLALQDHGDGSTTRFRNIWVMELDDES